MGLALIVLRIWELGVSFEEFCDLGVRRASGFSGIGCCRNVLWYYGMGPLAHCCPNYLPPVLILSHSWDITVHSCWESRFPDESRVSIWLRYYHCFHDNWVVCHCFISAQCPCRVRTPFPLSFQFNSIFLSSVFYLVRLSKLFVYG